MLKNFKDDNSLFDGDDKLFKFYLNECNLYFEYGVGKSTRWVLDNTKSDIIAIDTDKQWIASIDLNNDSLRAKLIWIDLGDLSNWGRPNSYKHRDRFLDYIGGIWKFNKKADIILIDGRFRVACFFHSFLYSKTDTLIIFDDYLNRPWYHIVEEVLPIYKLCGRQGFFKVPKKFNKKLANDLLDKFMYVFD